LIDIPGFIKFHGLLKTLGAAALVMALGACASTAPGSHPPHSKGAPDPSTSAPAGRAASQRERMVNLAMSMLGQPYRFGGAAPGGFDCSGLVAYAAKGAGTHVPRTALEQAGSGRPVARGEVRSGDLVFMHLAHKELHVGIAIDGVRFIHAPSKGGYIRIDSLAAAPYARGFLSARRIIGAP
jgi:murein DD-endopeptidase